MDLGDRQRDFIDYYLVRSNGQEVAEQRTGARLPFGTRDVESLRFVFQVDAPPGEPLTIYLRIASSFALDFSGHLRTVSAFTRLSEGDAALSAALYGAFALLAIYCLLKALALRDPLYTILAVMLVAQAVTFAARDGWAARVLWPHTPQLRDTVVPLAIALTLLMLLAFAARFLQLKRHLPGFYRFSQSLALALAITAVLIAPVAFGWIPWQLVTGIVVALGAPTLAIVALAGLLTLRKGFPPARFYVAALLIPTLFGIVDLAMVLGLVPQVELAGEVAKIGNLILVVMLSFAAGQAAKDAVEMATLNERTRLARELHDSVTQTLFSANIIAEMARLQIDEDPGEARHSLDKLGQLTSGALAEMRSLLLELRPAALQAAPLRQLLENLAQAAMIRSRVAVRCEVQGEEPLLSPDARVAVYRIAQELLNNVIKHSEAETCLVRLDFRRGGLSLIVRDDGKGFDQRVISPEHLGIAIMQERARAIGGELELCSEPGQGTIAELRWGAATEGAWQ
jgi:signal transduction histidine kinase